MSEDQSVNVDESETKPEQVLYSDVLAKLTNLQELSSHVDNHRRVLNGGAEYMSELITVMDEHKDETMDQPTAMRIQKGFRAFVNGVCQINMKDLFENDSTAAKESFYYYFNLLKLSAMKRFFQREDLQKFHNVLYGEFLSIIFPIATLLISSCKFTVADLEPPQNNREIFELLLNYIKGELDPGSTLPYSKTTDLILSCLWNYSDKTIVVSNLIQVGYSQAVLQWISTSIEYDHQQFLTQPMNNFLFFLDQIKRLNHFA